MLDYIPTLQPIASNGATVPPGYTSPSQYKSMQDYAKALMTGSGQQPVHHWTQGLSNMVSALIGGNLDYKAGQQDNLSQQMAGRENRNTLNGTGAFANGGAPPVPFSEAQPSEGSNNTEGGSDGDMAAKKNAISGIESGGDYNAVGPVVLHGHYAGQRANGKYQVMDQNVRDWTREVFGQEMTPADFRANPQAQEKIFEAKFTSPRDWFGHGSSDGYMAGSEYQRRYDQAMAKSGGGGRATAFAGPDGGASGNPAVQATAAALRGGGPAPDGETTDVAAAGKAAPGPYRQQLAQASGQPPVIDPALVPRPQTNITPRQLDNLLGVYGDRLGGNEFRKDMYNRAIQQGQPVTVQVTGGHVIVDPRTGKQQFFPDIHWGESGVGEIKGQEGQMVVPDGKGGFVKKTIEEPAPAPATAGPRSEAPVSPPAPPTGGMPTAAPGEAAPPVTASAAPSAPLAQVASLDPTAGVGPKAASPAGPTALVAPPAQPAAAPSAAATTPLAKFAQGGPPPGVSPTKWQAWQALQSEKINNAAKEEMNKEEITLGMKGYDKFKDQVGQAQDLQPKVEASLALLNDPRIHTGMAAGLQDTWSRFKEAFLGEKGANAPNELFDKLAAGQVLGIMRSTLQGLGQVRLAEINLLNKANASRYYGDSANRAVLEVARTGLEKVNQLGQMANEYVSGRDVVDPNTGKVMLAAGQGRRHGLDADFNTVAQNWANEQNKATTEKYKDYDKLFDTGRDPSGAQLGERDAHGVPVNPKVGQEHIFNDDKGNPMTGVWNGKNWGPKGQTK